MKNSLLYLFFFLTIATGYNYSMYNINQPLRYPGQQPTWLPKLDPTRASDVRILPHGQDYPGQTIAKTGEAKKLPKQELASRMLPHPQDYPGQGEYIL